MNRRDVRLADMQICLLETVRQRSRFFFLTMLEHVLETSRFFFFVSCQLAAGSSSRRRRFFRSMAGDKTWNDLERRRVCVMCGPREID